MDGFGFSYRSNYLDARLCYGQALLEWAKYGEAAEMFSETLTQAPDSAPANFGLASALAFEHKFPEAIERYKAALQLEPDYWQAQLGLAQAEMSAGLFEDARIELTGLSEAQPTNVLTQFTLGSCLNELGQTNEARSHFASTLALDPAFAPQRSSWPRRGAS